MTAALLAGAGVIGASTATGQTVLSHPRTASGAALLAPDNLAPADTAPDTLTPGNLALDSAAGPRTAWHDPGPTLPAVPFTAKPVTAGTADPQAGTSASGLDNPELLGTGILDTDGDDVAAWQGLPEQAPSYVPRHAALPAQAAVPASMAKAPAPPAAPAYADDQQQAPADTALAWVDPLPEARVTSCFGQRWGRLHAGVDLAATYGTRIRAAGAGTVVAAGPAAGYGNAVLIDHGNGYLTHYGHMSVITARPGQRVAAGEQIGNEGSTGHSTGPHLHFEVHQGFYKNPIEPTGWMHAHGVDIPGCVPLTGPVVGAGPPAPADDHQKPAGGRPTAGRNGLRVGVAKSHPSPAHRTALGDPKPVGGQQFRAQRERRHPTVAGG